MSIHQHFTASTTTTSSYLSIADAPLAHKAATPAGTMHFVQEFAGLDISRLVAVLEANDQEMEPRLGLRHLAM